MTLRLDDIAVFVANWENKVDNIKYIQKTLNIGFDSIVFLDDNPFERNLVRELLPDVTVPELPEDPSLFVSHLSSLNLFETASFSEEDSATDQAIPGRNHARVTFQKSFTSIDDYLKSLGMISVVKAFDDFSLPRVAQLTQRSNQFNLRTVRYTEADIDRIRRSDEFTTLSFNLRDKFGDYGLIGVIILKKASPSDGLHRHMDHELSRLKTRNGGVHRQSNGQRGAKAGVQRLIGEYLPTAKNRMVKDLYPQMGFEQANGKWELDLQQFKEFQDLYYNEEPMKHSSEQVLAEVNRILCEVLENDSIELKNETTANDVKGWDSLSHIELVVAVEKHFKIRFNFTELQKFKNVGEMCDNIAVKLAARDPNI